MNIEWIDCRDELPEIIRGHGLSKSDNVLVTVRIKGDDATYIDVGSLREGGWLTNYIYQVPVEVIAWSPLPEPYERPKPGFIYTFVGDGIGDYPKLRDMGEVKHLKEEWTHLYSDYNFRTKEPKQPYVIDVRVWDQDNRGAHSCAVLAYPKVIEVWKAAVAESIILSQDEKDRILNKKYRTIECI